jgi:hypothetical protein
MRKPIYILLLYAAPMLAQSVSGTIPSTGGGTACVSVSTDTQGVVGISVTGTWSGTLQPQVAIGNDAAANVQVTPSTSSTAQNTITANGVFTAAVSGSTQFYLCGNTVASGTANVKLNVVKLSSSKGGGSGGSTTPGNPATSIQYNNSGAFAGDANNVWNNNTGSAVQLPARSLTIGPTTNLTYYGTLQATPLIYSENTNTDVCAGCTTRGPFTMPYNFWTFLGQPAGDSAIEMFNLNASVATTAANTHNYSNEQTAIHAEADHNGTGTVADLIGYSGEAYNLGNGTVTNLSGSSSNAGTLSPGSGNITNLNGYWAILYNAGGGTVSNAMGFHVGTPSSLGGVFTNYTALQIDSLGFDATHNPNVLAINVTNGNSNFGTGTILATNLTTTGQIATKQGTTGSLALYLSNTKDGFYNGGSDTVITTVNAFDEQANDFAFGTTVLGGNGFGLSNSNAAARDVSMTRGGAGILDIGTGALSSTAGTVAVSRLRTGSLTPTCTFTSGGGTSPSCSFRTGSTDVAGTIIATTGTGSPAGTGTITLTFSAGTAFAVHSSSCIFTANDGGSAAWAGIATMKDTTPGTTSDLFTWTNQPPATGANTIAVPTPLAASTAYWINYHCWAI